MKDPNIDEFSLYFPLSTVNYVSLIRKIAQKFLVENIRLRNRKKLILKDRDSNFV